MKTRILLIAAAGLVQAFAGELVNVDKQGLALQGYDPVAYFTANAAVKGDPAITTTFGGATYRFASTENRQAFEGEPTKYAPQFGGFCAYAVSRGKTAKIDPTAFEIVDGRLLLQYDHSILKTFNKGTAGNLAKADANWPKISSGKK